MKTYRLMNIKREKNIYTAGHLFTLLKKVPRKSSLEKQPLSFPSRNKHHPLQNTRGIKLAMHKWLPRFGPPALSMRASERKRSPQTNPI